MIVIIAVKRVEKTYKRKMRMFISLKLSYNKIEDMEVENSEM